MGCGTGLQGVVMGLYGAEDITFSDLSENATVNTKENVTQYGLLSKSTIVQGDLFERVENESEVIVFNHPFFKFGSIDNLTKPNLSETQCTDDELIHRFLEDAKAYPRKDKLIIMPYFHMAGETNDPGIQAPKHNYSIIQHKFLVKDGLQQGPVSIYELRPK